MIREIFELQNPWRKESGTKAIEVKWNKTRPPKSFQTIKQYDPEMVTKVISTDHFF
jgi:hypothetical protein